jgi:hypothetical protein
MVSIVARPLLSNPRKANRMKYDWVLRGGHRVVPGKWLAVNRLWEPRSMIFVLLALLNNFKAYAPPFCDSVPEINRLTVAM